MLEKARQYDGPLTFPVGTPVLRTVEVLMIPLSGFTEWVRILQCLKDWQMGRILVSLNRLHSQCNWKKKEQRDQFTKYFLLYLEKLHFTYFTRLMSPASDYKILIGILIRL